MTKEEAALNLTPGVMHETYTWFVRCRTRLYTWQYLPWLILACSALNVILIGGKRRAFGIFIADLKKHYNSTSMAELNWIGDSYASLGFFLMPFATTMVLRLQRPYRLTMLAAAGFIFVSCFTSAVVPAPAYLFLTHTVLHGLGSTLVLSTTALVTEEYFDKTHRFHVLATTFISGGSYGVLICGPLFSTWIATYDWRVAFELCGVLFLFVCSLGGLFFVRCSTASYAQITKTEELLKGATSDAATTTSPMPDGVSGAGVDDSKATERYKAKLTHIERLITEPKASDGRGWAFCSWQHIKDNPQIFLWCLERLMHNLVMYGLMMNLVSYATQAMEKTLVHGSRINLYFGIGESVVFTVGALFGDRIRGYLSMAYLVGAVFAAIFLLIIQSTYTDINVANVLAGFLGASIGVGNTFLYATAEEVMLVHGSIAFPMTKMVAGVGMLLAPLLSGMIIDGFSYRGFFISMVVLVCLRVLLLVGVNTIIYRKRRRLEREAEDLAREMGCGETAAITHCCSLTNHPCGDFNAIVPRASITDLSTNVPNRMSGHPLQTSLSVAEEIIVEEPEVEFNPPSTMPAMSPPLRPPLPPPPHRPSSATRV